jgi:hypothetical protein
VLRLLANASEEAAAGSSLTCSGAESDSEARSKAIVFSGRSDASAGSECSRGTITVPAGSESGCVEGKCVRR